MAKVEQKKQEIASSTIHPQKNGGSMQIADQRPNQLILLQTIKAIQKKRDQTVLQRKAPLIQMFTEEEVRIRAYEIWIEKGKPQNQTQNQQDEDYFKALFELKTIEQKASNISSGDARADFLKAEREVQGTEGLIRRHAQNPDSDIKAIIAYTNEQELDSLKNNTAFLTEMKKNLPQDKFAFLIASIIVKPFLAANAKGVINDFDVIQPLLEEISLKCMPRISESVDIDIIKSELNDYMQEIIGNMTNTDFGKGANLDLSTTHNRENRRIIGNYEGKISNTTEIIDILSPKQIQQFRLELSLLAKYCDDEGKRSIIEGAAKNVKKTTPILDEDNDRSKEVFINRLKLMGQYVRNVGNKTISKTDNRKIFEVYKIKSTGSDPHAGGVHALFLTNNDTSEKKVYKEHSLQLEYAFMGGQDSLIGFMNSSILHEEQSQGGLSKLCTRAKQSVFGNNQLPTMDIDPENHTEEFVSRVGDHDNPYWNPLRIKEQMRKLGMLEAIASTLGITDLHGENVMFTKDGPVSVDGECGGAYGGTGIESGEGVANINESSNFINPSALYLAPFSFLHKQVFLKDYKQDFNEGKDFMIGNLRKNKKKFLNKYEEKLANIDSFRIVPIATTILAWDLQKYLEKELDIKGIGSEVNKTLKSNSWTFNSESKRIVIEEDKCEKYYLQAFEAGTLPAFTFLMKNDGNNPAGSVLLDNHRIGGIDYSETELKEIFSKRAGSKIDASQRQKEH